jgi:endonuclease YncB( thermonuclease family)
MIAWRKMAFWSFLLWAVPLLAGAFTGRLVKVLDGDTVEVMHNGKAERIRLEGIDAPEKGQAFSQRAKDFILTAAAGKTVTVQKKGRDRYGRTVAEVVLPDGRSLNRELVRNGYAWWYRQYSKDVSLGKLEAEARKTRRGLWSAPNPVPPWEWRRAGGKEGKKKDESGTWKCGKKDSCSEMTSCKEAMYYLKKCGVVRLDRDNDGIPCEALCR